MSLTKTKINWQTFKRIGRKQLFREVMQEGKKESVQEAVWRAK